jgi:hypothetical protein
MLVLYSIGNSFVRGIRSSFMRIADYSNATRMGLQRFLPKKPLAIAAYCAVGVLALTGVWLTMLSAAPVCDRNATDASSLASEFAAAGSGETICLATGSYGTWTGGNKSVTITAADGATPTMGLDFNNGDGSFILDNLTITSGAIVNDVSDITIRNSTFTGILLFDNIYNANILLENNTHNNIEFIDGNPAGRISFPYGDGATHSGVTIRDSLFRGGSSDGIQTGVGVNIFDYEFDDIQENGHPTAHTDSIQLLGAYGTVVRGNYVHDGVTGIVAYDQVAGVTIENNVVTTDSRPEGIELYSDVDSVIQHNTVEGSIYLDRKLANPVGTGTIVKDNIATSVTKVNGSSTAEQTNNLLASGAGAGDISGTPTYVGGSNPTSYNGYALAGGSLGKAAASDGEDVGILVAEDPGPDSTPPTAAITSPTDGATVQTTISVTAAASDNIGIAGVTFKYGTTTIGSEDISFPYSVNWNTANVSNGVYTLTAIARDSSNNTTTSEGITVTVDNDGVAMARSVWNDSTVPATPDGGDGGSIEVGMKFQSAVAGEILGVRFYKAPANTGTHVGRLWSLDGTEMAQVTFGNETASGWQEALFSSPVEIEANTTYMVSYYAPAGHYSVNGGYFASSSIENYPLTALQNGGADGMNGMFRYGSGGVMPDANFNATNYWVDVVFEVPDTIPPAVNISTPTDGAVVRGIINLDATASDNTDVTGVQFKRGCPGSCVNIGAEETGSPYAVVWDTTQVADGEYELTATARDAAGNTTTATNVTVRVDNTPPDTAITAHPVHPSNSTGPSFTFTATETATYECKLDGGSFSACTSPKNYTGLTSGSHTFTVRATDTAGNVDASPATYDWVLDATAPTVAITKPSAGTVSGKQVAITAVGADNRQLAGIQFKLDGVNFGAEDLTAPYTITWDSTTASNGSHTITAVARDSVGNTTTSAGVAVQVSNTTTTEPEDSDPDSPDTSQPDKNEAEKPEPPAADDTAPTLSNIRVTDLGTDSATINWESSEPASSEVVYYKHSDYDITVNKADLVTKHALVLTRLDAATTYTFVIKSTDAAGNETVSEEYTFTSLEAQLSGDSEDKKPKEQAASEPATWVVPAVAITVACTLAAAATVILRRRL